MTALWTSVGYRTDNGRVARRLGSEARGPNKPARVTLLAEPWDEFAARACRRRQSPAANQCHRPTAARGRARIRRGDSAIAETAAGSKTEVWADVRQLQAAIEAGWRE